MNVDTDRYTIGELSALTGLPVRTIRFYSDAGLVPEAGRTPAGYRQYDVVAVERLGLVRTLRDLGIDLATVRRVLASEVTMAGVAAAHARSSTSRSGLSGCAGPCCGQWPDEVRLPRRWS